MVRSIDAGGLGGIDRQVTEKMSARAKRFNLESSGPRFEYEDFVRLYDAFGVPEGERDEKVRSEEGDAAPAGDLEKKFRLQAVTVKGFGSGTDKNDVYEYFKEFSPVSMELVDGNTINVVWALPASAAKAMLSLSRPLMEREMEMEVNEVKAGAADGDGEEEEDEDEDEDSRRNRESKEGKENLINKAELVRRVSVELGVYLVEGIHSPSHKCHTISSHSFSLPSRATPPSTLTRWKAPSRKGFGGSGSRARTRKSRRGSSCRSPLPSATATCNRHRRI